ncbi:hypothetical protein MMC30_004708 [Trapelia coarctata]|nr:hypothetical protein [Trapelia coarctata]
MYACNGLQGNADFYGLGIRIGIYLQWISSLLTNLYAPNAVSDSLDTNSIFIFAVLVAMFSATASSEGFRPAEASIMLQLCFGYLLSVMSVSGLRLALLRNPHSLKLDLWLAELRKSPDFSKRTFSDRTTVSELLKGVYQQPLENIKLTPALLVLLNVLDTCILLEIGESSWQLLPISQLIGYFSFLILQRSSNPPDAQGDPIKLYLRERLQKSRERRALALRIKRTQLFSLSMKSIHTHEELSNRCLRTQATGQLIPLVIGLAGMGNTINLITVEYITKVNRLA